MTFLKFLFLIGCVALGGIVAYYQFTAPDIAIPTKAIWEDPDAWGPWANVAYGAVGGLAAGLTIVGAMPKPKPEQAVTQADFDARMKALEDQLSRALAAKDGAPVEPDRAQAKAEAIERTVREEPDAAREIAEGHVEQGIEDLKAAARQDAANAARKWRDIGALAYDTNRGEALAAYREATRLDADDFWAWVYLSRLELDYAGDLPAARLAAEKALAAAKTERERSAAHDELGAVALRTGDLSAARAAYEESLAIRRAPARDEGDAQAQRDISISLDQLGDVALRAGDLPSANAAFEEGLAIARALARKEGNARAQRDVSISLNKLGAVALRAGDLTAARAAYEESLAIRRALARDEGDAQALRDVSFALDGLGDVALRESDLSAAKVAFEESLTIRRDLARDEGDAQAQRDVSVSLSKLGEIALLAGELEEANAAYEESLAIARALARKEGNAEAQRHVSVSLEGIGDVALRAGNLPAAKAAYEESLTIRRALARDEGDAEAQRDVIVGLAKLAEITGDAEYWRQALPVVEGLAARGQLMPEDAWMLDDIRSKARG